MDELTRTVQRLEGEKRALERKAAQCAAPSHDDGAARVAECLQVIPRDLADLLKRARADLMKMRERSYGGRTVDISAHIKGRSQKNTFRLHFYIDRENELIVIGHAGCHMKTAGSHRRGFK